MLRINSAFISFCITGTGLVAGSTDAMSPMKGGAPVYLSQPLVSTFYTADPAVHVFNNKLYIYSSHDIDAGITDSTDGKQYAMRDCRVLSIEEVGGAVTDHGVALDIKDIPWASHQLWAPDAAFSKGKYFLYFPVKDSSDIFRIGVATSASPTGPFVAEKEPIKGSYSIDPAIFSDDDGSFYLYFGGLQGGQLQRWPKGLYQPDAAVPTKDQLPVMARVVKMSADMLGFAETVREIQIIDDAGVPIVAGDDDRRFFEACWVHKYKGIYYFSYSTGGTHKICYATGHSPYGPFTYRGVLLKPVQGWTTHQSIVEFKGKWYLFYHDTQLSGKNFLRNVKMTEIQYNEDGTIQTIDPFRSRK